MEKEPSPLPLPSSTSIEGNKTTDFRAPSIKLTGLARPLVDV